MADQRRSSSHAGGLGTPSRSQPNQSTTDQSAHDKAMEDAVDNSRVYFSVTEAPSCADDVGPVATTANTPSERRLSRAQSIGHAGNYITKNDPLSTLNAHITSAETRQDALKKYTVFRIAVTLGDEAWVIFRRYSQFHAMYLELVEAHGKVSMLPKLPPKRISPFGNLNPEFVEKRRRLLNQWLRNTLGDLVLRRSSQMLYFLDVVRHTKISTQEENV